MNFSHLFKPMPPTCRIQQCTLSLLFILLISGGCRQTTEKVFPKNDWERAENPEEMGWSPEYLDKFRLYLERKTEFTGLMIVHKGKVVFNYGDLSANSYIASCRKSMLAVLYGKYVKDGTIDLDASLEQLGVEDLTPLLASEKKARVKDLMAARSGIYLRASNRGDFRRFAPERGSVQPGTYWLYNNWDFNTLGYIFEQQTGKRIYDEIENQLAVPLKMQDWDKGLQRFSGDSTASRFMAYHMWFSTRDMARIGHLLLNKGNWNGLQLVDSSWIAEMVTSRTPYHEAQKNVPLLKEDGLDLGYGYMWWLLQNQEDPRLQGAYSAQGAAGQGITVYPAIETVLAYKTNTEEGKRNSIQNQVEIIKLAGKLYHPVD